MRLLKPVWKENEKKKTKGTEADLYKRWQTNGNSILMKYLYLGKYDEREDWIPWLYSECHST